MTVTLIEGLILLSVAGVGGIVWWGVLRLVSTNDQTLTLLTGINGHLAAINGRLGKTDTWIEMHQRSDDKEFLHINENLKLIWDRMNENAGQ